MSERRCPGCNALIPRNAHHNRKWCSETCRKRAWDKAHPKRCRECGAVVARTAGRCLDCHLRLSDVMREARWVHIKTLWDAGIPMDEIAPQVGRANRNALGVEMDRMKKAGWNLARRRPTWTNPNQYRPPSVPPSNRHAVNQRLGDAVRRGKLTRPDQCERCGDVGHVEGHHHDYSKPLDVEWLCRSCHAAHHAAERKVAA